MKDWGSPVYAFFGPVPEIEYIDGRRTHVFKCLTRGCSRTIRRYLDKGDAKSTSNMWKHARSCYGEDIVNEIAEAITVAFERKGMGQVSFSARQHTKSEAK